MNVRNIASFADRVAVVTVSLAQKRSAAPIPIAEVIHHGIDLNTYRYGPGGGGFLLFIGRMCEAKGVHRAVQFARQAGKRLVIVTKIREAEERRYYEQQVRPLLGPDDPEPRELALRDRVRLLQAAEALLNPIDWPEPFGLVMAEALARGTPVLAFPRGAAPEIVEPGRTGFLCTETEDMLAAIDRIPTIDRRTCRAAAERRFDMHRMARDHVALYRRILAQTPSRAAVVTASGPPDRDIAHAPVTYPGHACSPDAIATLRRWTPEDVVHIRLRRIHRRWSPEGRGTDRPR
ncbi:glycosyltransferase [Nocardia vinacea]|uniref:glycosyltransferase n=1 Tax=Nocardia vinacea TaxID=96468 RepID=UPI0033CBB737